MSFLPVCFYKQSVWRTANQKKCFVQEKSEDHNINKGFVREQKDKFIYDFNITED
jgi:hypothetical protein